MEDHQLLNDYVAHGSEQAFGELVRRHLGLVHSTALRLLHDTQLAEEVCQAVFILLARKAVGFHVKTVLAGWLYRTTRFVAARALRAELRRRCREQEAFDMQQISSSDETWKNLAPILDDALGRLSSVDRDAILLRYFQEEPLSAVGEKLGLSEEAARKRIDRALKKLKALLGRRGIRVTTVALGATLAAHGATAAPPTLAASVTAAACSHSLTHAGVMTLVEETLSAWRRAKAIAAGAALVCGVIGLVWINALVNAPARSGQTTPQAALPEPQSPGPSATPDITTPSAPVTGERALAFAFRAVDAATGKGLGGAKVLALSAEDPQHLQFQTNLVTDAEGRCAVPLASSNVMMLVVGVLADGYQEKCAFLGGREPLPAAYTLALPRGSAIGGVVRDEGGNPVVDAGIVVQFHGIGDADTREFQRERPGFPSDDYSVARTDAAGRWRFGSAPETNGNFWIQVKKPGFPTATVYTDADEHNYGFLAARVKLEDLHAGTAVLELKGGFGLHGVVTDERGLKVAGAKVSFGEFFGSGPVTRTLADGAFTLAGLPSGKGYITVTTDVYAPERLEVDISENTAPITVHLKPGALLRLRVVDQAGKAVVRADVRLQGWRGNNTLEWGGLTDEEGRIEWKAAPHDQVDMFVGKEGFFYSRDNLLVPDVEEHLIKLNPKLVASGYVLDADTKELISAFKAVPGSDQNYWQRHNLVHGTNGFYRLAFEEYHSPFLVRFEAEGYEPAVSPPLNESNREVSYDVELRRQNPQDHIQGIVLLPDGSPGTGVQVALCTAEKGVTLGQGKFLRPGESILVTAGPEGRFVFAPGASPRRVVAVHQQGFGSVEVGLTNREVLVQLRPWGRIEGRLMLKNKSNAGQQVALLNVPMPGGVRDTAGLDLGSYSATTDTQGNFVLEQVPPGEFALYRNPGAGIPFDHATSVEIQPGVTTRVQMGGMGTIVKGRLVCPGLTSINWPKQVRFGYISTKSKPLPIPPGLTREQASQWQAAFWSSEEGRARAKATRSYPLSIQPDGSFTAEDVLPGTYVLHAILTDSVAGTRIPAPGKIIGSVEKDLVLPEGAGGASAECYDVGTLPVRLQDK